VKMSKNRISMRPKGRATKRPSEKMVEAELKQLEYGQDLTSLTSAPTSSSPALTVIPTLVGMATGTGSNTREGLQVQAKRLLVTVNCVIDPHSDAVNANMVANAHHFRVIIVCDRVSQGSAATWSQVFDTVPNNQAQEFDYPVLHNRRRFKILVDEYVSVPPPFVVHDGATFHSYGNKRLAKFVVPLNFPIWFNDNTASVGSVSEGNIFMFVASDASSTALGKMKFSYRSRLLFTDY